MASSPLLVLIYSNTLGSQDPDVLSYFFPYINVVIINFFS